MSSEESLRDRPDPSVSELVDKVMRGEIVLFAPPGTWAAALVVPCFAIGVGALSFGVALCLSRSLSALHAAFSAALALLAWPVVGQALIIFGRAGARKWLRMYSRGLAVSVVAAVGATYVRGFQLPWSFTAIALVAFLVCDRVLGSRPFLAFSSFFSLKRRYRADQQEATRRVLGR